jgi:uncharacterized membrane protein YsdA (DUF1294 family)
LGAVNVGAFGLFGYDKMQASNGGWRVSEADLCKSALFGGWLGGMLAMAAFRHKTRKASFQEKFMVASAKSAATGGAALALACRNAAFRMSFTGGARGALAALSNVVSKAGESGHTSRRRGGGGPRRPRR